MGNIKDLPAETPTLNLDKRPSRTALSNILLMASITNTNNKGDRGSPCRNPLELPKNPWGEPLIRIEKRTVDKQKEIHRLHLTENPQRSSI